LDDAAAMGLFPNPPLVSPRNVRPDTDVVMEQAIKFVVEALCRKGMHPSDDSFLTALHSAYKRRIIELYNVADQANRRPDEDGSDV
jgi:hypothetical protein